MTEHCVICLENINDDKPLIILDCDHLFHKDCIDDWVNNSRTCPVCRENINNNTENITITTDNTDNNTDNIRYFMIKYLCKLYFIRYITTVDLIVSIISILIDQHGILFFLGALWGFLGSYILNSMLLILYIINRGERVPSILIIMFYCFILLIVVFLD